MGKCATTAIQEAAFSSLKADAPVRYFPKTATHVGAHNEIIPRHGGYDKDALSRGFMEISSDSRDCFLSSELISSDRQIIEELLSKALQGFNGRVRAVITVRRPSDWYWSNFAQKVKVGQVYVGESFDDFVARTRHPAARLVSMWREYIGNGIRIVPYETDHFLERFFSTLGLNTQHFESLNISKNVSLNASQIKQLQEYDERKGNIGEPAKNHRKPHDFKRILTASSRENGRILMRAQTKRTLAALDCDYATVLQQWRLCSLLAE